MIGVVTEEHTRGRYSQHAYTRVYPQGSVLNKLQHGRTDCLARCGMVEERQGVIKEARGGTVNLYVSECPYLEVKLDVRLPLGFSLLTWRRYH